MFERLSKNDTEVFDILGYNLGKSECTSLHFYCIIFLLYSIL